MPTNQSSEKIIKACTEHIQTIAKACESDNIEELTIEELTQSCVAFGSFLQNTFPQQSLEEVQKALQKIFKDQPIQIPIPPLEIISILSEIRIRIIQDIANELTTFDDTSQAYRHANKMLSACHALGLGGDLFKTLITQSMDAETAHSIFEKAKQKIIDQSINKQHASVNPLQTPEEKQKIEDGIWNTVLEKAMPPYKLASKNWH